MPSLIFTSSASLILEYARLPRRSREITEELLGRMGYQQFLGMARTLEAINSPEEESDG